MFEFSITFIGNAFGLSLPICTHLPDEPFLLQSPAC